MAEVAEVHGIERIRRPATATVLGVGGMRHPVEGKCVVLNAEINDVGPIASEVGDKRIVGVANQ